MKTGQWTMLNTVQRRKRIFFEESTDKEQMDESDGEDEEDWQVAYAKHCAKKEKELDSKGM